MFCCPFGARIAFMGGDCALTRAVDPIVFCCLFWARLCVWGNGASPRAVTSVIFCDPYDGVQGGVKSVSTNSFYPLNLKLVLIIN